MTSGSPLEEEDTADTRGSGPVRDAWTVPEVGFPQDGEAEEQLRYLVRYAVLAPSGHNTQPWLFKVDGHTLELHANRARALPVVDPDDRELIISCGAALETLLVAMRHFGRGGAVQLMPKADEVDLLARVALQDGGPPSGDEQELFAAIAQRRTNRQAFDDRELPRSLTDRLVDDADGDGVWLDVIRNEERAAVGELVAEGDRVQMADRQFRRELAAWVHPNHSNTLDGMRGYGFGVGDLQSYGGALVIRSFDMGKGQAAKDRELVRRSPLLAVLGTAEDDPASWLRSGRALQRVLLRARAAGVWSSYLNQPIEVRELRPKLADRIGRGTAFPQLLVRFGYGPGTRAQPRRAVQDVFVGSEPS